MMNTIAEQVQEKALPTIDGKKLFVFAKEEQEADTIGALREKLRREAESMYAGGDIEVLTDTLSILAERGIYRLDSLRVYVDIQETMKLLKEKYAEITDTEIKTYADETLLEAEEALQVLKERLQA